MSSVRRFLRSCVDFVAGDDRRLAAGIVLALGASAALAATGTPAWWFLPLAVVGLLADSLRRRLASRPDDPG